MKKLPIGIQTFSKIRIGQYCYVDKTRFVADIANDSGEYYFLSRPRRFGKSLFPDTLNQAFSGNKEYFSGVFMTALDTWLKCTWRRDRAADSKQACQGLSLGWQGVLASDIHRGPGIL